MKLPLAILTLFLSLDATMSAFRVEPIRVPSAGMHKEVPVRVILPEGYQQNAGASFPVLYLLHGAGDNDTVWIDRTPIASLADQYGVVVVCPAAELSWYFDSPEMPGSQYESFITGELIPYIDGHYHTRHDRLQRALAGNSMGGHGALFLGIRHTDLFGVAVGLSGGVDFRPFPHHWNLDQILGTFEAHPDRWNELTVLNQAKRLHDGELALSIDCGTADFFIAGNRALHEELLAQKVAHDYTERPGSHGWPYWAEAIKFQMLYISDHFQQAEAKK